MAIVFRGKNTAIGKAVLPNSSFQIVSHTDIENCSSKVG